MRFATAALAVCLLAPALPARAGAKPGARALGRAYRAFEAGDYARARRIAGHIDLNRVVNDDYVLYVAAQAAYFSGDANAALATFEKLARARGSRFRELARWRVADCLWRLGRVADARDAYRRLLRGFGRRSDGDPAVARFRIAEAAARLGDEEGAKEGFHRFLLEQPAHPLEAAARRRLIELGGAGAAELSPGDRVERAIHLTGDKKWQEAIAELSRVDDTAPEEVKVRRDFWLGMTLFKMRRHYPRAAKVLLGVYGKMKDGADEALFHGARALSRSDRDEEAIGYYQKVVDEFPHSRWADEAQFLSGWLQFNLGHYRDALPYLVEMRRRYPRSHFAHKALWYLGYCHLLLGEYREALPYLDKLAKRHDKLVGGKGQYWKARALQKLGEKEKANRVYRDLVGRFPFSWYALLAQARLREQKIAISPLGDDPPEPDEAPPLSPKPDRRLARDPVIRAADELIAAGMDVEAGYELRRKERAFLRRHRRDRAEALATLMDRYHRAQNYHRPWVLAIVRGGRALRAEPKGRARRWWESAYPLAYRKLVEKWRGLGDNPPYYLYTIMRKESGFDPHTHSYADARGLLQMIPPTTRQVVRHLGLPYTEDMLFDPELNIRAGSWYIGRLLKKFGRQIPLAAASYNAGPRPMMHWLKLYGDRPIDEFVERVSYRQARRYMRRVTETYARYLYLYAGEVYEQPLKVDPGFKRNDLTY